MISSPQSTTSQNSSVQTSRTGNVVSEVSWGVQDSPLCLPSIYVKVTHPAVCEPLLGHRISGWWSRKCLQEVQIWCTCFPSHSAKSCIQSCNQYHLQMRNEQTLTMENVIHQSSKLKSNKIRLNADERVGKRNEKKSNHDYELILSLFIIFGMYLWGYGYTYSAIFTWISLRFVWSNAHNCNAIQTPELTV